MHYWLVVAEMIDTNTLITMLQGQYNLVLMGTLMRQIELDKYTCYIAYEYYIV